MNQFLMPEARIYEISATDDGRIESEALELDRAKELQREEELRLARLKEEQSRQAEMEREEDYEFDRDMALNQERGPEAVLQSEQAGDRVVDGREAAELEAGEQNVETGPAERGNQPTSLAPPRPSLAQQAGWQSQAHRFSQAYQEGDGMDRQRVR